MVVSAFIALCVLATAGTARAAEPFGRLGAFAEQSGDGLTSHHKHVAVNWGTGAVLVANTEDHRIDVYRQTGGGVAYVGAFGQGVLSDPFSLSVDQVSGTVYISDAGASRIFKYRGGGNDPAAYALAGAFVSPPQGAGAGEVASFASSLAVAPDGDLLVADSGDNVIKRFDADGRFDAFTMDGSSVPAGPFPDGPFAGLLDIAVDSTGDVIVIDQSGGVAYFGGDSRALRFASDGRYETTFSGLTKPGAVAVYPDDEVVISDNQDSYNSSANLMLHLFGTDSVETASFTIPGDQNGCCGSAGFWSNMTGLAVGAGTTRRLYAATDVDALSGLYGAASIQMYGINEPSPPDVVTMDPTGVGTDIAGLRAQIAPNGLATTYYMEYGSTADYGRSVPLSRSARAGDGYASVAVTEWANGLQPGATYHYRAVAQNALGVAFGDDRTFVTKRLDPSAAGEGRRFELVSPLAKGGNDIEQKYWQTKSSPDGNRAIFSSVGAFDDPRSSPVSSFYLARRGADGWNTTNITPPSHPVHDASFFPRFQAFSSDLSKAAFQTGDPALVPGAQANTGNLYVRDNNSGGDPYTLLTPTGAPDSTPAEYHLAVADASDDFSHVAFEGEWPLTADAPVGVGANVYEWARGELRLASILPDGRPAQGAFAGPDGQAGTGPGVIGGSFGAGVVSTDGDRIFFTDRSTGQLYVREGGRELCTFPLRKRRRPILTGANRPSSSRRRRAVRRSYSPAARSSRMIPRQAAVVRSCSCSTSRRRR